MLIEIGVNEFLQMTRHKLNDYTDWDETTLRVIFEQEEELNEGATAMAPTDLISYWDVYTEEELKRAYNEIRWTEYGPEIDCVYTCFSYKDVNGNTKYLVKD